MIWPSDPDHSLGGEYSSLLHQKRWIAARCSTSSYSENSGEYTHQLEETEDRIFDESKMTTFFFLLCLFHLLLLFGRLALGGFGEFGGFDGGFGLIGTFGSDARQPWHDHSQHKSLCCQRVIYPWTSSPEEWCLSFRRRLDGFAWYHRSPG
jgi:hypothetical protein